MLVRGLCNALRRVTVLGTGLELVRRRTGGLHNVPGDVWIDAPTPSDLAPHASVLALEATASDSRPEAYDAMIKRNPAISHAVHDVDTYLKAVRAALT
ncbi:hypothetical protein NC239_34075 [Streptomyces sp. G3]|uniref:hypothetical protein n=1 Tax=unclassified Streptomyces TaxID=2593676 RepID=UPI001BEFF6CF|nr:MULTISPECIES: hypothetical protein [unclassified Streptomyces]MCM1943242.1 hypothetical protein [Streptomyces sp. G3]QUW89404.1 hypothetical protein KE639_00580 [Streptomyces sp. V17-9]WKX22741.1 hypothetical protein Q3Y68_33675 [Streptomyces sp. HUAS CX7]